MIKKIALYMVSALLLAVSCKSEVDMRKPNVSAEITISGLSDDCWTYFSFEKGCTVGKSDYCDEEQDEEWAARKDWDFAICGDKIKTNSGESGDGMGGVQRNSTEAFTTLEEAPAEGYLTDTRVRTTRAK